MLTGDHVMHGSTVVIRPPDGDLHQYLASLARVRDAEPPIATLAPGHGRLMDHVPDVVDALIAHRLGRHERVAGRARPGAARGRSTSCWPRSTATSPSASCPWPASRCGPTCARSPRRAGPPSSMRRAGEDTIESRWAAA